MKFAIAFSALLLSGCGNLPILQGLGLPGIGGQARLLCNTDGTAELVQGVGGISTTQPLPSADVVCARLKAKS